MRDPLRCEESPEEACHESYQICLPTFDQTDSLAGGNSNIFEMFTPILGEDAPNLTSIFFKGVGSTTNQRQIRCFLTICLSTLWYVGGSDKRRTDARIRCIFRILNEEPFIQNIRIFFESQGSCCHCMFFPGEWYIYMTWMDINGWFVWFSCRYNIPYIESYGIYH